MIKSCEKCISIEENMRYKTYTREEYLEWCRENNVKNPLTEYKRNKMTECGYPTHPYDPFFKRNREILKNYRNFPHIFCIG